MGQGWGEVHVSGAAIPLSTYEPSFLSTARRPISPSSSGVTPTCIAKEIQNHAAHFAW